MNSIKWVRHTAVICLAAALATPVKAQENFFLDGLQFGVGARAIGMGGAYSAVGNDYSASFWNPAALASVRRFEITGGFTRLFRENDVSFNSVTSNDEFNITRLNEIGVVYPVPTYRGSLVFSFGFNRVRNFDTNFTFDIFNPLEDDMVTQVWQEQEKGYLNNWTAAAAVDVTPQLSAGLGVNFWSGENEYNFTEQEFDSEDIYTFSQFSADSSILSELSGFNMSLGLIYRLNNHFRVSASVSTPTTLTVKEDWAISATTDYDDLTFEQEEDDGFTEYKIRSPFKMTLGASLNIGGLLVSGQIEERNWENIEYRSEPPFANLTRQQANREIAATYQQVHPYRLGAEYTLPGTGTQIRGGYYFLPSPFKKDLQDAFGLQDREFYSLGLGILLDKQLKLDIAYVVGKWDETTVIPSNYVLTNYVDQVQESVTLRKIFATLSFRL